MTAGALTRFRVAGFRSLRDVTIVPTPVTVLIGPNGAGKSNLLWAFEMVRMLADRALQLFVSERGGATFLLHYGPKKTPAIELGLEFDIDGRAGAYDARLGYGADESLVFEREKIGQRPAGTVEWRWIDLGAGHRESRLSEAASIDPEPARMLGQLQKISFYHFHDTSRRSALRTRAFADTGADHLRGDGSNLPSFLHALRAARDAPARAAWRRIEGSLSQIAPFITALLPVEDRAGVRLEWRDERKATFGPAHLSDGTLRALALIAALAQPEAGLPLVSCIDEPELGLHPAALGVLCGLISSAAARRQVIVSTQSPVILDHFEPDQVVVAERRDAATRLRRLDAHDLGRWLEDYSLSELYDKNVLGGRP